MGTKENVLHALERARGAFVSGESMAEATQVSRTAVWKAIKALQGEGYPIEARRNAGYRMPRSYDVLSEESVFRHMRTDVRYFKNVHVVQTTGSTNTDVREMAAAGAPEFTAVVAARQEAGRGRRSKAFFSLGDCGVYLSILIRPTMPISEAQTITCAAAVAVCRAIEGSCEAHCGIKWVNDVYVGHRKVCGILTEAATDFESGGIDYAVVGIGVNVYEPNGGFPKELRERAGALQGEKRPGLRGEVAAAIIREFGRVYETIEDGAYKEEYRRRSFLPGKAISVIRPDGASEGAWACSVNDDLSLRVRFADGHEENLTAGEVSIRVE